MCVRYGARSWRRHQVNPRQTGNLMRSGGILPCVDKGVGSENAMLALHVTVLRVETTTTVNNY